MNKYYSCYSIGEISTITGISKNTLNFYLKKELLFPCFINESGYRFFGDKDLWQLEIISMLRKLNVPLKKVKLIIQSHDNEKVTNLLKDHKKEALQRSNYYLQIAKDIDWYNEENKKINKIKKKEANLYLEYLNSETVIANHTAQKTKNSEAFLTSVAKEQLDRTGTIQRKYGYLIDPQKIKNGIYKPQLNYVKLYGDYNYVDSENLMVIPAGNYLISTLHIKNNQANFSQMIDWINKHNFRVKQVFAEEIGLQLFHYNADYYSRIKILLGESD